MPAEAIRASELKPNGFTGHQLAAMEFRIESPQQV
jgi:hypothetical protein